MFILLAAEDCRNKKVMLFLWHVVHVKLNLTILLKLRVPLLVSTLQIPLSLALKIPDTYISSHAAVCILFDKNNYRIYERTRV
jgi:hypothetical protein